MEFVIERGVLKEYCGTATEVVIPAGVRKIGNGAFKRPRCRKITRLTVPEGVTTIGNFSFQEMEALTDLTLPSTLRTIGSQAFSVCTSLRQLQLPAGVKSIGFGAFECCVKLETVQLPEGLTQIQENTFRMCGQLTRIHIPEGVTEIGDFAFGWCSQLTELRLPESVRRLGENVFYDCKRLKTINVPRNCVMARNTFTGCFSLADPQGLVILQNRLLVHYPDDHKATVVIPDSVEAIEDGAFVGRTVRHVEMNLRCPLWNTYQEGRGALHIQTLFIADGSTIAFRDDKGGIVAKVILAVDGERLGAQERGQLSIRQRNHAFDFAWYDATWEVLQLVPNRLRIALVRLQYPYALPDSVRTLYEGAVAAHSTTAGKLVIDSGETELLSMLLAKKLLRRDTLSELVDYASQAGAVTMTAQLLAARHADPENTKLI